MSKELNKALDLLREIRPSIPKDVLELWCKDRDALLASHPASAEQAGGDERAAFFKHLIGRHPAHETEIVRVVEHNHAAWKAWQARAALAQPSPAPTMRAAIDVANDRFEVPVAKWGTDLAGEEERPEVVAFIHERTGTVANADTVRAMEEGSVPSGYTVGLMTVAQHESIVGALRAERDGAIKLLGQSVWQKIERLTQERDAAQARVAAATAILEVVARYVPGSGLPAPLHRAALDAHDWMHGKAPAAQAGQVPGGWKLVPIDPTSQMTFVGQSLRYDAVNSIGEIYRQMIAAAPA